MERLPTRSGRRAPACGNENCRFPQLFALLGKAHVTDLLFVLGHEGGRPMRFTALQRRLALHPKLLSATLREMEAFGLVIRAEKGGPRPRVEYSIPIPLLALAEPLERFHQIWEDASELARAPDGTGSADPAG